MVTTFQASGPIPTTIKDHERVEQRRAEIVDVATHMFLERGFHKTSIRDIVRACPFNIASLYMYVSSKEDILFLVAQHVMVEKAKAMGEIAIDESDPAGSFKNAFATYCRVVDLQRRHVKLLYRELDVLAPERRNVVLDSVSAVVQVFENIITMGKRSGGFQVEDTSLAAHNTVAICHSWSLHGWAFKHFTTIDTFIEVQSTFLLRGLGANNLTPR